MFILIICILVILILGYVFNKEITTEEFLLMALISIVVSGIVFGLTCIPFPNDIYYESGRINRVEHHPYFKERYQQAHTVCTSNGKSTSCHTYYTTEYCKHREKYIAIDTLEQEVEIDRSMYFQIGNKFGNKQEHTFPNRMSHFGGRCVEGDSSLYSFNNITNTYEYPTTKIGTWYNPLKRTKSLFNNEKKVWYPRQINWRQNERSPENNKQWDILNTKIYERVKANVILVKRNTISELDDLKLQWNSGKRNDIVIGIAEDGVKVFGWYDSEILSSNLETYILDNGLNLQGIEHIILSYYKEFDFKEFKYLKKPPAIWQIILTAIITLIVMGYVYSEFSSNYTSRNPRRWYY